jgi:hypothetical protein
MRLFNKESDMTYSEFRVKFGYQDIPFPLNEWRDKSNMTDEEKKSVSGWEQMGGYLKTLGYKEAWAAGWAKATEEQKKWYQSLPNFSWSIFTEITGIESENEEIESNVIELNGIKYRKITT